MDRQTREQVEEARQRLEEFCFIAEQAGPQVMSSKTTAALQTLLAATAPPPDVPRPADMAELAQAVARELRGRGIWAQAGKMKHMPDPVVIVPYRTADNLRYYPHSYMMCASDFDKLSVTEIAALIQSEESKRAKEWAGDG
jgi:hypothetical protein